MGLLWRKGATKYQKVVAIILSATIIGPFYLIFTHNFVAEPRVSELSSYASIVFTACLIFMLAYLYTKKLWRPAPVWHTYSKFKKVLLIPFVPLFLYGLFWVNLAISMPQVFTLLFGTDAVKRDVVVKDRHYSRRSCDYRLEPQTINAIFFHYCISESFFNQLPETAIESELLIKQSPLGYIVEDIRLLHKESIGSESLIVVDLKL